MLKFIGLILLLVFLGILVFGIFLGKVIRFFGPTERNRTAGQQSKNNQQNATNIPPKKFAKDEGEYVNYEEIKEEE